MGQNTTHAVMAQRIEPPDSLDDFPSPPWAARALCEHVLGGQDALWRDTCWEPAANRGFMARGLANYFAEVWESDIERYGRAIPRHDFLFGGIPSQRQADWIISNPPFRLAAAFISQGIQQARLGTAMLVRTQFLEGVGRFNNLFFPRPPTTIAQFAERVPMVKGRCDPKASTATAYCWLVWEKGATGTAFMWIPPCRSQLERPGDYS